MKANIAIEPNKVEFDASRPVPTLAPGEVLVKVIASAIQPSDWLNISGKLPNTKYPVVPGRDYAGIVVEPKESSWYNRRVYGTSGPELSITRDGVHAEFVAIPEEALATIPKNLDYIQASMIGTSFTTAELAVKYAHPKKGETALVVGAGGKVGQAVIQILKSSRYGCQVLTAGRGDGYDVDTVKFPDLSVATDLTQGKGPDIVIETTGYVDFADNALKILAIRGRLSIISTATARGQTLEELKVDLKKLYRREHTIVGCNSFAHSLKAMAEMMAELGRSFEAGELRPPTLEESRVVKVRLEDVVDVYKKMGDGAKETFLIENDL